MAGYVDRHVKLRVDYHIIFTLSRAPSTVHPPEDDQRSSLPQNLCGFCLRPAANPYCWHKYAIVSHRPTEYRTPLPQSVVEISDSWARYQGTKGSTYALHGCFRWSLSV